MKLLHKKVLATKTLKEDSLRYAKSLGLEVCCKDFIEIEKTRFTLPEFSFDSIVFTSANAVISFATAHENVKGKSIFALNGKTNETLLRYNIKAGFTAENAESLAEKIIQHSGKSVLHICGNLGLDRLEKRFENTGISYRKLIAYNTILRPSKAETNSFDAVLFFSPSGVKSFFSANELPENVLCVAIGRTTAEALKLKTANKIIIPSAPTPEALFDAILSV